MSRELADLAGIDVAGTADTVTIDGFDIGRPGRNPGAVLAIAEDRTGVIGIVGTRDVVAIPRPGAGKIPYFGPLDLVDRYRKRALGACGRRRRDISQRRLMQRKTLERLGTVAVAEYLADRLPVSRVDYIAVDRDVVTVVAVGKSVRQGQCGVNGI